MGREFELKYAASEETLAALQARYAHLSPIRMETTYYDTQDSAMAALHWTLRLRLENGEAVCTLKTPAPGGARGEWEVRCGSIHAALPLLVALGAPEALIKLTSGGVAPVCGARFTRLAGLIEAPGCTVELALDRGVLTGGGRELPLCEAEVELKAGSEKAAAEFAGALAAEYSLTPEPRSKVRRARALAGL